MKLTPWIAALTLTMGLTPALRAQQYGYPRQDGRYDSRYGNDSWRYGNPNRTWHSGRVSAYAHDIDEVATYIHEQAERNNRRPDREEARALAQLHELNDAAEHFHEQVEQNNRDYRHTRDDFAELIAAYNNAVDALRYIQPRPYVDRGMNRIASDMTEIARYYGSSYGRLFETGRWGRSGRDGYDRYDRDGRYDRDSRYDSRYDRDRDGYDDRYRPPVNRH
jgi:hypothetical protein